MLAWNICLRDAIGDAPPGLVTNVMVIPAVAEDLGLDLKKIGLNGGGTTHAPQQRCDPEHQLALHRSSGVVINGDSCFECLVIFDVFQSGNDGFSSQSVPKCISPRPPLASFGLRPVLLSALRRLASICRNEVMACTAVDSFLASMSGSMTVPAWALLGCFRCGCSAIDPRELP